MSKVGSWSTTPGSNNTAPPDGWPEGQAPSTVNDCGREMMSSIRTLVGSLDYIDLNNTPSFLTTTTFSLGTSDVTNWEIGRRVKLFDATTLYGTIISVSATFVQVRLDSGVLTTSLSSAALGVMRNTSPALPDAAFNQQNVIVNGSFDIWQRTASVASVASNQYVADRFKYLNNNSAAVNLYRDTNVPTLASAGVVLNFSLTMVVSAIDAVIAAGDFAGLRYDIEGLDWRRIAHRPMGVSFQAYTNRSGIYALSLRNTGDSVSYVQTFTISAINTWTRFFVPIPAAPTTPYTWDYSTGTGLAVTWALAAGSSWQATAGSWSAGAAIATSAQVNFLATAGNLFSITDIRLKVGGADTQTSFRTFAEELQIAQRYYEIGQSTVFFYGAANGAEQRHTTAFRAVKRVTPSMSLAATTRVNVTTATLYNISTARFDHSVICTVIGASSDDSEVWSADAEL